MGSNTSAVKTPNVQATGLMANPSSSQAPQSSSPIPFNQPAPYFTGQQWQMPYPYVSAAPNGVPNVQQQVPVQNSRQKSSGQPPVNPAESHLIHHHHVYPQVMSGPQAPVSYPVPQSQQPFPIWPTNFAYIPQQVPTQIPQQVQESGKTTQQTTQPQQQTQQQTQQTTETTVPLLKMAHNNGTNTTQPEATQQQTTGQTQPNAFVQLSQQKFAQPIDYSLPAPPKSFCPQYRSQPKVQMAPMLPQQVQFSQMNVGMPFGYAGVQPAIFGQQMDYMGGFIQPPNPFGTCNQAFQAANTNGFSYQPIAQY